MTFQLSRRDILFVANMAAADSPIVRWVYAGLGVIPVSRVRDARGLKARGQDASAINANAFTRVVDALKAGQAVAIFPEGNVNDAPHLGLLRNGAAKMALQAVEAGVDLTLIPVGYQYESPTTPRSGLLAVVGARIRVADWKPVNATKAVTEFTKFMRHELQLLTRNSRTHKDAESLSTLAAVAGAVFSANTASPMAAAHPIQLTLSQHSASDGIFVANAVAPAAIDMQESLEQVERNLMQLSDECVACGARRWSARDCADVLAAAGDQSVSVKAPDGFRLLLTAPLALLAWMWHTVPMWIAHQLALRFAPLRVEIASRTIVPGLYIMELWYLIVPASLLALGVNRWLVLALLISQPRLGDVAILWRDTIRVWKLYRRVNRASDATKQSLRVHASTLRERWIDRHH